MSDIVIQEDIPGCIRDCSECSYFDPRSGTCEMSGRDWQNIADRL